MTPRPRPRRIPRLAALALAIGALVGAGLSAPALGTAAAAR